MKRVQNTSRRKRCRAENDELSKLREKIRLLDEEILVSLAVYFGIRKSFVAEVGKLKRDSHLPVRVKGVEMRNLANLRMLATRMRIPFKVVTLLFEQFALPESRRIQEKIIGEKLSAQKKKKSIKKRGA